MRRKKENSICKRIQLQKGRTERWQNTWEGCVKKFYYSFIIYQDLFVTYNIVKFDTKKNKMCKKLKIKIVKSQRVYIQTTMLLKKKYSIIAH